MAATAAAHAVSPHFGGLLAIIKRLWGFLGPLFFAHIVVHVFYCFRTSAPRLFGLAEPVPQSSFGQFLRYFAAVLFVVPKVRLIKFSQNAPKLTQCVSSVFNNKSTFIYYKLI